VPSGRAPADPGAAVREAPVSDAASPRAVGYAELARRRPFLTSPHFGLAIEMPVTAREGPGAAPAGPGEAAAPVERKIGLAVPKRLLRRAVDRNACKRVAREAWRLADWHGAERPALALIKLRRSEPEWKTMSARALRKAWRVELDELLLRCVGRLRSGRGPRADAPRAD
jgi:hypothetical protein